MISKSNYYKVVKLIELLLPIKTLPGICLENFDIFGLLVHHRVVMRAQTQPGEGNSGDANADNFGWSGDGKDNNKAPGGTAEEGQNTDTPKFTRYPSIGNPSNYSSPYYFNIG